MKLSLIISLFFIIQSSWSSIFSFGFRNDGLCNDLPRNLFLQVQEAPKQKLLLADLENGKTCYAVTKRNHDCMTEMGTIVKVTSLRPLTKCSSFKKGLFLAIMKGKANDLQFVSSSKVKQDHPSEIFNMAIQAKGKNHGKNCKQVPCTPFEKDIITYVKPAKTIKLEGLPFVFTQHHVTYRRPSDKPNQKAWDTETHGPWSISHDNKITVLDGGSLCFSPKPLFFQYKGDLHFYMNNHCCNCGWSMDWIWKKQGQEFGAIYSDSNRYSD